MKKRLALFFTRAREKNNKYHHISGVASLPANPLFFKFSPTYTPWNCSQTRSTCDTLIYAFCLSHLSTISQCPLMSLWSTSRWIINIKPKGCTLTYVKSKSHGFNFTTETSIFMDSMWPVYMLWACVFHSCLQRILVVTGMLIYRWSDVV